MVAVRATAGLPPESAGVRGARGGVSVVGVRGGPRTVGCLSATPAASLVVEHERGMLPAPQLSGARLAPWIVVFAALIMPLFGHSALAQGPSADFTVTPATPTAGAQATFRAVLSSHYEKASVWWHFGVGPLGPIERGREVTHTFGSPGDKKVTMAVVRGGNVKAITKTVRVVAVAPGPAPDPAPESEPSPGPQPPPSQGPSVMMMVMMTTTNRTSTPRRTRRRPKAARSSQRTAMCRHRR